MRKSYKTKAIKTIDAFYHFIGVITIAVFVLVAVFGGEIKVNINFNSFFELFKSL